MRFHLVDRIVQVMPGRLIQTAKNLTLAEEYLADHFPTFPVMPGVLMLQTLVESGAWLWRISDEFRHSIIVLREAKNVKYGQFMEPGRQMQITVELVEQDGRLATFKGKGEMEGSQTVAARFTLTGYNLRDRNPAWQATDEKLVNHYQSLCTLLRGDVASQAGKPGVAS